MCVEYGGSMKTKSADPTAKGSFLASALRMSGLDGARSNPIGRRPVSSHTSMVVPLPHIGSTTTSPSRVYLCSSCQITQLGVAPAYALSPCMLLSPLPGGLVAV